jgi:hypothetical protein
MTSAITLRSCPQKYILDTHRSKIQEDTINKDIQLAGNQSYRFVIR